MTHPIHNIDRAGCKFKEFADRTARLEIQHINWYSRHDKDFLNKIKKLARTLTEIAEYWEKRTR